MEKPVINKGKTNFEYQKPGKKKNLNISKVGSTPLENQKDKKDKE